MNAEQLLGQLYALGVHLAVEGGQLQLSAPDGALSDALLSQVRSLKQDLIDLLDKLDKVTDDSNPVVKVNRPMSYKCATSLAQQRMLFLEELAGRNSYYNIPLAFQIKGRLIKSALNHAFAALVNTHDILRTVYKREQDGETLHQFIRAQLPFAIIEHDLSNVEQVDFALAELLKDEANYCFDLSTELPIRVSLITLSAEQYVLSMNIHHIAADGYSAYKIMSDLGASYRHFCTSENTHGEPLQRNWQYADYVSWQENWLVSSQFSDAQTYWLEKLNGAPQLHSVMPDYPRPAVQLVAGSHIRMPLPAVLSDAIARFARERGTTPFMIYQAVFAALLARYSGESDIVFGTAVANRLPLEFNQTVGLFVNTLALRFAVDEHITFSSLIDQAKLINTGAMRHQQYPFDVLVEQLQPVRSLAYNPIVQMMLVMQDEDAQGLKLDGVQVERYQQQQAVSKFDIALHICARGEGLELDWEFNTSLFKPATIERMSIHFQSLLQACVDGVIAPGTVALVNPFVESNTLANLEADPGAAVCVHHLFEQQVVRSSAAVALYDGDTVLSYAELNDRAELVACHLSRAGAGANTPIGVLMEKSSELVVAMLAIYKVGGTYVPLDPHYPPQRLSFMLKDAGVKLLVGASSGQLDQLNEINVQHLYVDQLLATPLSQNYPKCATAQQGAYIIYTSGSTGQPKGVLVSHANLYYSLHANRQVMGFSANDLMPTVGSQAFGVSLLEMMLPLTTGGAIRLVRKSQVVDVEELVRASNDVAVFHAVPSLMRQWLDVLEAQSDQALSYPNLRLLLVGGETVPDGLLKRIKQWRPSVRLLALYGMTESAIVCSSYEAKLSTDTVPAHYCIGKPYQHARFYVLSREGQQQPLGVPGELFIGGLSIATEYVGQVELTAERFLNNPFCTGDRMYRTGDRARLLEDGNYEFLGRVDHQVSLRGARIEMGEIETLANGVVGVTQTVAHVAEQQGILVLYFTSAAPEDQQSGIADAIRQHLAQHLPDYMRPSIIECLAGFPLNPNGKVDRKKLPTPLMHNRVVLPESEIEQRLLELCQTLLQRQDFGVTANFFEIGGHSLLAAKLVTKIRATFAIAFPLTALYSSPTIRACAALVELGLKEKFAASLVVSDDASNTFDDEMIL